MSQVVVMGHELESKSERLQSLRYRMEWTASNWQRHWQSSSLRLDSFESPHSTPSHKVLVSWGISFCLWMPQLLEASWMIISPNVVIMFFLWIWEHSLCYSSYKMLSPRTKTGEVKIWIWKMFLLFNQKTTAPSKKLPWASQYRQHSGSSTNHWSQNVSNQIRIFGLHIYYSPSSWGHFKI